MWPSHSPLHSHLAPIQYYSYGSAHIRHSYDSAHIWHPFGTTAMAALTSGTHLALQQRQHSHLAPIWHCSYVSAHIWHPFDTTATTALTSGTHLALQLREQAYYTACHFRSCPAVACLGLAQNHIFIRRYVYTVYIRYFNLGNHHTYGHIRCVYTVLANPKHALFENSPMTTGMHIILPATSGHAQL